MKEIIDKQDFIKIKKYCSVKDKSREWKNKPQTGIKYLQEMLLRKDCYPKYTETQYPFLNDKPDY